MKRFLHFLSKAKVFQSQPLLILVLLFLISSLNFPQNKSNYSFEKFPDDIVFINKVNKDGSISCELATAEEKKQFFLTKPKDFNYTIVHSLNPQNVRGLKILLRATDQLLENKDALLAFRRAAARWERYIRSEITVVIDVDYGLTRWGTPWGSGVLGSTTSAIYIINGNGVSESVQILKDLHPGDAQLQGLYNAIPVPTPTTANSNLSTLVGGMIPMQLWGYFPQVIDPDLEENPFGTIPAIGFNSAFGYDFDPSDGIEPGKTDFDAVVTHEIGHALGHVSIIGNGGPPENWFLPWDLFRVRPEAVEEGSLVGFSTAPRIVTPGPPPADILAVENNTTYYKANHIFFDGLTELELSTATGGREGGDGQQASHWRDDNLRLPSLGEERTIGIMDPTLGSGIRDTIKINDLRMFEVIGYNIQYVQDYAKVLVVASGDTVDIDRYTDTLYLGDMPLNFLTEYQFEVINMDLDHSLNYESEIVINFSYPVGSTFSVSLDNPDGTIPGGTSTILKLIAGNSAIPAQCFGTLRLHTNDENHLVLEIPFEFSVAGARAPVAVLSENDLGDFEFNTEQGLDPVSKSFNLSNSGTIDLTYRLIPSLSARSNTPVGGLAKSSGNDITGSVLSKFITSSLLKDAEIIYQNNFESGWGGFTASGLKSEDWQIFTLGSAALDGHSKPAAAYYGHNYGDSLSYRDTANAVITSYGLDFTSIPPEDKVVLTFNYFLDAEEGYDFASVLVSLDNGVTFEEVATSNNGILHNTDAWESVMIELPNLSGNPDSVRFAFKFKSDDLIEGEGWYIDDIEISTIKGVNTVYTIPRSGIIPGLGNPLEVTVTINGAQLGAGYYHGNLLISSNDPFNPVKGVDFDVKNFLVKNANVNTLYASTGRGTGAKGKVISINLSTGVGTELGPSGFEPLKSITINPLNNKMYAFAKTIADTASKFIRINSEDGFGLYLFESKLDFTAMTFDVNNTLYLTTSNKRLYRLNPETGDSEFVANIGINVSALAVNPSTGEMWAAVDESSEPDRLYKIDKTTGDTIHVGRTGLNRKTRGLVFGPEDELYGVTGEETAFSNLIKIDKSNGTATEIGAVGFRGVFGMAYKYDPTIAVKNPETIIPNQYELSQNYPNPFNPSTTIKFGIPESANVKLTIYNLLGQEVATLVNKDMSSGYYTIDWNAATANTQISSGIYFYNINATGISGNKLILTKKMMLLK